MSKGGTSFLFPSAFGWSGGTGVSSHFRKRENAFAILSMSSTILSSESRLPAQTTGADCLTGNSFHGGAIAIDRPTSHTGIPPSCPSQSFHFQTSLLIFKYGILSISRFIYLFALWNPKP